MTESYDYRAGFGGAFEVPAPAACLKVLQMYKNAGNSPPAVLGQAGAKGSAPGGSQGAVDSCYRACCRTQKEELQAIQMVLGHCT